MKTGFCIVHKEYGIFMGCAMGLGFFSKMDCAGQICAPCFLTEGNARKFLLGWYTPEAKSVAFDCLFFEVDMDIQGAFASIDSLRRAGLEEHFGLLGWPDMPEGHA